VNIVVLNWQRQPWEGDQEVVRRSGRGEPMWVAIHKCMETMLGISLYSYLHLKLAKMLCLSYYLLFFSSTKSENKGAEQVLPRSGRGGGGPNHVYTMFTHINVKMIK
jgi:hypothetical protein